MKCEHDNCLTCPYPDCIATDKQIAAQAKEHRRKPGRKKIDPELKKENARRWQREYYQQNKEAVLDKMHKYYQNHAEEIRQKQKEYRDRKRGKTRSLFNIWITNGKTNKRIKECELQEFERLGWKRGRCLSPYNNK